MTIPFIGVGLAMARSKLRHAWAWVRNKKGKKDGSTS